MDSVENIKKDHAEYLKEINKPSTKLKHSAKANKTPLYKNVFKFILAEVEQHRRMQERQKNIDFIRKNIFGIGNKVRDSYSLKKEKIRIKEIISEFVNGLNNLDKYLKENATTITSKELTSIHKKANRLFDVANSDKYNNLFRNSKEFKTKLDTANDKFDKLVKKIELLSIKIKKTKNKKKTISVNNKSKTIKKSKDLTPSLTSIHSEN